MSENNLKSKEISTSLIVLILLSSLWILIEIYYYYLEISHDLIFKSLIYKDYSPDYFLLIYIFISMIIRLNGIINFTKSNIYAFNYFLIGQLMAVAISISYLMELYPFFINEKLISVRQIIILIILLFFQVTFLVGFYNQKKYLIN